MNLRIKFLLLAAIFVVAQGYTISSRDDSSTSTTSHPGLIGSYQPTDSSRKVRDTESQPSTTTRDNLTGTIYGNPSLLGSTAPRDTSSSRSSRDTYTEDKSKLHPTTLTLDEVKQSPAAQQRTDEQRRAERDISQQSSTTARSGLLSGSSYSNSQNSGSFSTTSRYGVSNSAQNAYHPVASQYGRHVRDTYSTSTASSPTSRYGASNPSNLQNQEVQSRRIRETETSSTTSSSPLSSTYSSYLHPVASENNDRQVRDTKTSTTTTRSRLLASSATGNNRNPAVLQSQNRHVRDLDTSSTTRSTPLLGSVYSSTENSQSSYHPVLYQEGSRQRRETELSTSSSTSTSTLTSTSTSTFTPTHSSSEEDK